MTIHSSNIRAIDLSTNLIVIEYTITVPKASEIKLGFTFSFPVLQTTINSGTLIAWTKGFDSPGVVGQDPAALLQDAFHRQNIPVRVGMVSNNDHGESFRSRRKKGKWGQRRH